MVNTRSWLALLVAAIPAALMSQPAAAGNCAGKPFDAAVAWQEFVTEFSDNYAYLDRADAKAAFADAAPAMRSAPDRLAFADRLETFLLLFRDSHLHVSPTSKPSRAWIPSAADLWFDRIDGRIVVSDVKYASDAAARGIRPGWELVSIDGVDSVRAAGDMFTAIGVRGDDSQLTYAINALAAGRLDQARRFVFKVGGKRRTVDLPAGYASVHRPKEPLTVSHLTDAAGHDVAVLRVNNALGDTALISAFDQAVAALPESSHILIDMRDTPSGGTSTVARAIIGHFVPEPRPYQRHELTVERVRDGVPRVWLEYVQPRTPLRAAPVVLAGRWTGSMGEGIVIGLNAAAKAPIAGSDMGKLLGAIIQDELPASCITISLPNEKLWHVDGRPREEVQADLRMSTADVAADGSDAALALALAGLDR